MASQRHTLLPSGDCLYALQPLIGLRPPPTLFRQNTCIYGQIRSPEALPERRSRQKPERSEYTLRPVGLIACDQRPDMPTHTTRQFRAAKGSFA